MTGAVQEETVALSKGMPRTAKAYFAAAGRDRERFAVRRVTGCRSAAGHEDTDIQGSTEEGVAQTPVSMGI